MKVLHDLGQASLGTNGIANDTRNIADMLIRTEGVDWTGLLTQHAGNSVTRLKTIRGTSPKALTGKYVMSALFFGGIGGADGDDPNRWLKGPLGAAIERFGEAFRTHYRVSEVPDFYRDAIWRNFFAATMPGRLREHITHRPFVWTNLNHSSVLARVNSRFLDVPRLDTSGYDIYLTAEPKPVRVSRRTKVVHRYHDAIPFYAADTMVSADPTKYHFLFGENARRVNRHVYFVCNSEPTRRELLSIWPTIDSKHAVTIPCSVVNQISEAAKVLFPSLICKTRLSDTLIRGEERWMEILEGLRARIPDEFEYILAVAALEPKKNVPAIVRAYERISVDHRELKLVLVGNKGWKSEKIEQVMRPHLMSGNLYHLEGLPYVELQALMHRARCLVFPSIAEGFGLPPVEALVCETPSVCSNIPSLRWVMGDGALFADPYDPGEIAKQILQLFDVSVRNKVLAHRSEVLERFDPGPISQQWKQLLEQISTEQPNG